MMRYYLDTAPIIYLVEQQQPFATAVRTKLATPGLVLVTSELTRLESRILPIRNNDSTLLQDFDDYFANTIAEIMPLNREVVDRATEIRAQFNFKTPDALHLAAAEHAKCDIFLTNDYRLNRFTDITIEVI